MTAGLQRRSDRHLAPSPSHHYGPRASIGVLVQYFPLQFRLQRWMNTHRGERKATAADEQLTDVVKRERSRLRRFIRRHVPDIRDAEEILEDVFYTLVEANRLVIPIEHVTGWLFRVARNRIVDLFRARGPQLLELDDLLPSPEAGPDDEYARAVLLETLEDAIGDLPAEQRDAFIAHEVEGHSFKAMSAATGVGINTLLARKRYAVLRLRERLRATYEEMTKT